MVAARVVDVVLIDVVVSSTVVVAPASAVVVVSRTGVVGASDGVGAIALWRVVEVVDSAVARVEVVTAAVVGGRVVVTVFVADGLRVVVVSEREVVDVTDGAVSATDAVIVVGASVVAAEALMVLARESLGDRSDRPISNRMVSGSTFAEFGETALAIVLDSATAAGVVDFGEVTARAGLARGWADSPAAAAIDDDSHAITPNVVETLPPTTTVAAAGSPVSVVSPEEFPRPTSRMLLSSVPVESGDTARGRSTTSARTVTSVCFGR